MKRVPRVDYSKKDGRPFKARRKIDVIVEEQRWKQTCFRQESRSQRFRKRCENGTRAIPLRAIKGFYLITDIGVRKK